MVGTAMLALGIVAAVVFLIQQSVWLIAAALTLCVVGLVLLGQVGRALS